MLLEERKHSETAAEPSTRGLIAMRVLSTDGGAYNEHYTVSNLMRDDLSCYCSTKWHDVDVMLAARSDFQDMIITHVTVATPARGFTSPLRRAIVFTSQDPPEPGSLEEFNGGISSEEEYLTRKQSYLALNTQCFSRAEPVLYLDMADRRRATFQLAAPAAARFIMVKMIAGRHQHSYADGENIDCQYLGFHGFTGPYSSSAHRML